MSVDCLHASQEILGYTLIARLGAGGYGEVWMAEAPGGLKKALKLIHGFHDEARAQRELKSLNHVKELRHPFLLSLERIDVVDGRLIVVTELADKCLKDYFDECVGKDLEGIPRDELLSFLRESAEALDFISNDHSLQHLDIKPENLLLVGSHVKVADFGLVKDLHDCTQSIMGGLTPAFSAPELFDGRPTPSSDQYSLAIVYQDMLTGNRPFTGNTPAQLAAQHMHGRPNLKSLPRGDQTVVNRALSKDPASRYPSCSAFISELENRSNTHTTKKPNRNRRVQRDLDVSHDATKLISDTDLPLGRTADVVEFAGPLNFDVKNSFVRPTLFLGVGATGTRVVCSLRQLLRSKFAADAQIPTIKTLCIDSDRDHLLASTLGLENDALGDDEFLDLPLRRSEDYRKSKDRFGWLSRRWIYNIPRSQNTEGIRPLGRLAIVDHSERLLECLYSLARQLMHPESLAKTANTFERSAAMTPRVYVVASISGGIGSGSIPDLGWVARQALLGQGAEDVEIIGLFIHDVGRTASDQTVGAANSYCCLKELNHFAENGYPGDDTCGFSACDTGEHPFNHVYFVHLGRCTSRVDDQYEQRFAELLFAETTTNAGAAFDASRAQTPAEGRLDVRTLGISSISFGVERAIPFVTNRLAAELISHWLDNRHEVELGDAFEQLLDKSSLTPDRLMQGIHDAAGAIMQQSPQLRLLRSLTEDYQQVQGACRAEQLDAIVAKASQRLDEWLVGNGELKAHISGVVAAAQDALQANTLRFADLPGHRLGHLQAVIRRGSRALTKNMDMISNDLRQNGIEIRQSEEAVLSMDSSSDGHVADVLTEIAERLVRQEFMRRGLAALEQVHSVFERLDEQQSVVHAGLSRLKARFRQGSAPADEGDQFSSGLCRQAMAWMGDDLIRVFSILDQALQQQIVEEQSSFTSYLLAETDRADHLARKIASICRPHATAALAALNPENVLRESGVSQEAMSNWIRERVEQAVPEVMDCGGTLRSYVISPKAPGFQGVVRTVASCLKAEPTLVPLTGGDVLVVNEVQGVSLDDLALRLLEESPASAELIPRLGTRLDVDWDSLTGFA